MPTATGRSTCKKDGRKRPRPARGVREGLSWMRGDSHVQFLGGGEVAIPPCYPALTLTPTAQPDGRPHASIGSHERSGRGGRAILTATPDLTILSDHGILRFDRVTPRLAP